MQSRRRPHCLDFVDPPSPATPQAIKMGNRGVLFFVLAAALALACVVDAFVGPNPSNSASLTERRRASTVVQTWVDTKVKALGLRSISDFNERSLTHVQPPQHQVGSQISQTLAYTLSNRPPQHTRWASRCPATRGNATSSTASWRSTRAGAPGCVASSSWTRWVSYGMLLV